MPGIAKAEAEDEPRAIVKMQPVPRNNATERASTINHTKQKELLVLDRIDGHNNNSHIANIPKFIIPNNTRRKYGNNTIENNQHIIIINPIHNP